MGRHVSVQCDDTSASATTLLLRGQTRLLRGQTRLCSVDDALALCYYTFVTWEDTYLFSILPYLRVPIMLRSYHSLLLVYTSKLLYDKNLNNEQ